MQNIPSKILCSLALAAISCSYSLAQSPRDTATTPVLGKQYVTVSHILNDGKNLEFNHQIDAAIQRYTVYINAFKAVKTRFDGDNPAFRDYYLAQGYERRAACYALKFNFKAEAADLTEAIKLRPRCTQDYLDRARAYRFTDNNKLAAADDAHARTLPPVTSDVTADLAKEYASISAGFK